MNLHEHTAKALERVKQAMTKSEPPSPHQHMMQHFHLSTRVGMNIRDGFCPACDSTESLLEGPHGGLSINVKCKKCGNQYNVCGAFGAQWIGHDD